MTTSTIFGNALRGQNVMATVLANPGVTTATVYANLTSLLTTKVTRTQSVNATGSTTNPTATFASTPASGSALLAIILRTADNAATASMPSGWTLLSGGGTAASRRAEIWWRRAGAAEPTTVVATNATAAAWNMTLVEYGGWATVADPVTISAATNVASTTSVSNLINGMLTQVTGLSAGSSWTTATLATTTGSNASLTQLATTTQANVSEVVGYNNSEEAITTFTLAIARGTTRVIAGWPHNMDSNLSAIGANFGVDVNATGLGGQVGIEFDTTSIYAANTVSSVTLSTKTGSAGGSMSAAVAECFSVNSTSIAKDATNTRTVWRTPTQLTALTRVCSRPASSAWTGGVTYAWASDTAFLTLINQGATTRLLLALNEQRTGTLSASLQYGNVSNTSGEHFLTIVHDRLVTIPTVTMTATPNISRVASRLRTITASLTTTPTLSRLATFLRTVTTSLTTTPTVTRIAVFLRTITTSLTTTPTVTRVARFLRTVTASLTTTPTVTRIAARLRTITASLTTTPTVTRLAVRLRTVTTSLTTTATVTRIATFLRTITASLTTTPTVTRVARFLRTVTASITAIPSLVTAYSPAVTQLPRILRLATRSTITLVTESTLRLLSRSTLKLPKE